jgi:hypothetical protein
VGCPRRTLDPHVARDEIQGPGGDARHSRGRRVRAAGRDLGQKSRFPADGLRDAYRFFHNLAQVSIYSGHNPSANVGPRRLNPEQRSVET